MDFKLCFILGDSFEKHTIYNKPEAEFPGGVKRLCVFTDFCGFFPLHLFQQTSYTRICCACCLDGSDKSSLP